MLNMIPIMDQLPGIRGFKDMRSNYLSVNTACSKAMGLKHPDEVKGMSDFDMHENVSQYAEKFQVQDRKVINEKRRIDALEMNYYADGWHIFLGYKVPAVDVNNHECIKGIYFSAIDVSEYSLFSKLQLCIRKGFLSEEKNATYRSHIFTITNQSKDIHLTPREHEIIFCLIHTYPTSKQIGLLLNISYRTVDRHIASLFEKFHVYSRNDLIDKAIESGFYYHIPPSLCRPLNMSVTL